MYQNIQVFLFYLYFYSRSLPQKIKVWNLKNCENTRQVDSNRCIFHDFCWNFKCAKMLAVTRSSSLLYQFNFSWCFPLRSHPSIFHYLVFQLLHLLLCIALQLYNQPSRLFNANLCHFDECWISLGYESILVHHSIQISFIFSFNFPLPSSWNSSLCIFECLLIYVITNRDILDPCHNLV